jgi:hypothetical protein
MEITWYGNARFRLRASGLTWWFDTAVQDIVEVADRATVVLSARSLAQLPAGSPAATIPVLDGPGEYELRGIPVFGIYPYPISTDELRRMHGTDERVSVESLRQGTEMLFRTLKRVAGTSPSR